MSTYKISSRLAVLAATVAAGLLSGCSASFTPNPVASDQTAIGNLQGVTHGGQAPISGAQIYLYAAGTTGYNTSSISLLKAASNTTADSNGSYYVSSDSTGSFSISGDYTCTTGTQVYMVGVGGDSGAGVNSSIVQMAALGQCPASGSLASQVPYVTMNEVSTVAFAYAVGGFGSTAYNISTSGTALAQAGIANAFANVPNILDVAKGAALATAKNNPNSVVSQDKINALANVLASCVNTGSGVSQACKKLFQDATADGSASGTNAANEAEAIFNIVHYPTNNLLKIFKLQPTAPPFVSNLTTAPNDWTLPVIYSGVVSHPNNIAFDASGNAWIGDQNNGIIHLSPQGALTTFTSSSYGTIGGVAVSSSGSAWAVDSQNNAIYVLNSSGQTGTIYGGGMNAPSAIAFDKSGNAFVANTTATGISKFSSSGLPLTIVPYTFTNISDPVWIAVDSVGNAWIPSSTNAYLGELVTGALKGTVSKGINSSFSLAVDSSDDVWVLGTANRIEQTAGGTLLGSYTGGGLNGPNTISIDGNGTLWVANLGAATVSNFSSTGTALGGGFDTGATGNCYAAAVDGSGNVWTANTDGTVTQLLGLAAPTATPLLPGQLGVKP